MQQGIQCNKCSQMNVFGSKFCAYCGVRLQYQCPQCGGMVEPGLRFCSSCGMQMAWDAAVQQPIVPQQVSHYSQFNELPEVKQSFQSSQSFMPAQFSSLPAEDNSIRQQFPSDSKREEIKRTAVSSSFSEADIARKEEYRPPRKINMLLIVLVIIVLLIAALFVADTLMKGTMTSGLFQSSTSVPVRATGTVNTTAQSLYTAYAINRMTAQMLYDDQSLEISGTILSTGIAADQTPFLKLAGGIDRLGVHCAFDKQNQNQIALLKPGSTVSIHGVCDGYYGSDVRLIQCNLLN